MSKITIRYGNVQAEFEGSEEFIKSDFLNLVSDIVELTSAAPIPAQPSAAAQASSSSLNLGVKSISARLGNSTGPDLARAAAAYLTLVEGKETFSQQELLAAMKSATGIYKQTTHGKNSGKILSSLLANNILLQTATGTFCLAEDQREQVSRLLNG
jgi:hypothetical protein